jgi:hypothetical protein
MCDAACWRERDRKMRACFERMERELDEAIELMDRGVISGRARLTSRGERGQVDAPPRARDSLYRV